MTSDSLILCPSARLARSIQNDLIQQQIQAGKKQWNSPVVQTLSQWLDALVEEGLLIGAVNEAQPPYALSSFNEQLLWEEVIAQSLKKNDFGELFDVSGLARAAIEANRYVIAWGLHIPRELAAEESRQFMQWQRAFQQRCSQLNVLEHVRYMDWQLAYLKNASVKIPARVEFAGFDQAAPQEKRLREILTGRGAEVAEYVTTQEAPALARHISLENQEAECRAAVAWARQCLHENPDARLAIVVPGLSEVRTQLADLLDDVFYPERVRPNSAGTARLYNFSLGLPLTQQPIIQAALNLLRMFSSHQLQLSDISAMLRSPFWSANQQEADARAMLDARMREKLPMQFTLPYFREFAQKQLESGLNLSNLLANMSAAAMVATDGRASPSDWVQKLQALLAALNWPGERNVTSLEYQALNAWQKVLQQFALQNILGKNLSMSEAVQRMQQICAEHVFQAETELEPSIQILGIMEALSAPVDALWCMHMNDNLWPPPARPNPLLPAFIQRAARLPNADSSVQSVFAAAIHQRLIHSAPRVIFSSSKTSGDSQLRVSPIMKDIADMVLDVPLAETLAEQLSHLGKSHLIYMDDHVAPAVEEGEHVSGGTGLLRAQAICPAWAFYQYRLGAKALKTPSAGLDSMERGSLVHDVLEHFWRKRHFADLRDMGEADLKKSLNLAVTNALEKFNATGHAVSQTVLELEQERLSKLIGAWLQFEKARGVDFDIVACEAEKKVHICGIEVTLKIDRIHRLAAGGFEFIDYKTGQIPKMNSWGEDRITEPQLPIYAAFYADDANHVAGVHFAMVKVADYAFVGVTEEGFETEPEKRRPAFTKQFTSWQNLLDHWKASIEAMALEIRNGEAAVRFSDENDLMYCEVKPLLRLPERKLQFERFQEDGV